MVESFTLYCLRKVKADLLTLQPLMVKSIDRKVVEIIVKRVDEDREILFLASKRCSEKKYYHDIADLCGVLLNIALDYESRVFEKQSRALLRINEAVRKLDEFIVGLGGEV